MFYVTKQIRGKSRRYLYEAYRDKKTGKPKRKLICYLGEFETVSARLAHKISELKKWKESESRLQREKYRSVSSIRYAKEQISKIDAQVKKLRAVLPSVKIAPK
jgi:hypothetical protein